MKFSLEELKEIENTLDNIKEYLSDVVVDYDHDFSLIEDWGVCNGIVFIRYYRIDSNSVDTMSIPGEFFLKDCFDRDGYDAYLARQLEAKIKARAEERLKKQAEENKQKLERLDSLAKELGFEVKKK